MCETGWKRECWWYGIDPPVLLGKVFFFSWLSAVPIIRWTVHNRTVIVVFFLGGNIHSSNFRHSTRLSNGRRIAYGWTFTGKKINPHFLNIKTYHINQQILQFMKQKHMYLLYFCCNYDIPKFYFKNITTISPKRLVIEKNRTSTNCHSSQHAKGFVHILFSTFPNKYHPPVRIWRSKMISYVVFQFFVTNLW